MTKTPFALVALLTLAAPAVAPAWAGDRQGDGQGEGGDVSVQEASISREDCLKIVSHAPSDDVAFRPGEDVYGNPVTPAEGEGGILGQISPPSEIVIDFGLDLAGVYGIPAGGLYTATGGILTIHYDLAQGALLINGKPLRPAESQAVAKACALMLRYPSDALGGR